MIWGDRTQAEGGAGGAPNGHALRGQTADSAVSQAPERNSVLREKSGGPNMLSMNVLPARALVLAALLALHIMAQPADPKQLFRAAVEAEQRGDLVTATRNYRQILDRFPDADEARVNLGGTLAAAGKLDEAIIQYRIALKHSPKNPGIRLNLALAFHRKGDFPSAAAELAPLHRASPYDARVAVLLSDCEIRLGKDGDAIAVLLAAEPANSGDPDLAWQLGRTLIRVGRLKEGVERIETLTARGSNPDAEALAAEARLRLDEYDQALKHADSLLQADAGYQGAHTLRGMALEHLGDLPNARTELEQALRADAHDANASLYLGAIDLFERNLESARQHLEQAVLLDSASALALYQLALCKRAQGETGAAVKDLEEVERRVPGWAAPHVELAALYYRLGRSADGALERKRIGELGSAPSRPFNVPAP